jgi:hypothetical protein
VFNQTAACLDSTTALAPRMQCAQLLRWTPLLMTTLIDDVADVETVRPAARSDTKAAIAYLIASGAVAISIVENQTGCSFKIGTKIDPRAAVVYWSREDEAGPVMRKARKLAGKSPDLTTATSVLHRAAADQRVTLTEHATAMMRAAEAAKRLDAFIAQLRARGAMREFTKMYKRRRIAATMRGEGFMSYQIAEARLRKALVPLLQGGATVAPTSLFSQIFDQK